jgi:hypothetical protein
MGRINKSTEGVFVNVVGNQSTIPSYKQFISQESVTDTNQDAGYCLADLVTAYSNKCSVVKVDLQQLADLEVLIMQIRLRASFKSNVKLYYMNKKSGTTYIYARCPFYRKYSDINEVRVLIDNAGFHTESQDDHSLSILSGNTNFMCFVYDKLTEVMDREIEENLQDYKKIYQNNLVESK